MPPRISKDRENLVAAAGSCLIQVRSMVTEQCIQTTLSGMVFAHYHLSATYVLPHVLLRGCVARICGETYMISSEVQQDLLGCIRYGHG